MILPNPFAQSALQVSQSQNHGDVADAAPTRRK